MANKPLQIHPTLNVPVEVEATVISVGAGDAGKIPGLDSTGKLDISLMPSGIGPDVVVIEASEALSAGDFVNIYDNSGTPNARKADASTANAGKIAHGYVVDNVSSAANASIYFEGTNDAVTGLTAGVTYALSHTAPGGVVALGSATTMAGHSLQILGVATSSSTLNVELGKPTLRG
jgi:hypothetical protein